MKNTIILTSVIAAALSMVSCSKWTDPESLEIRQPSIESENPELYRQYLESLREYKNSAHKIVIAEFDNKETAPAGRSEHISCLPDSIDFVILANEDNLSDAIIEEMSEIREKKGTKTLYEIDFAAIEAEWNAANEDSESSEEMPEEDFSTFIGKKMDYYISLYGKYGYDGICVSYKGKNPDSMTEDVKAETLALQNAFFNKITEWKSANGDAVLIFRGQPVNLLIDKTFLESAKYIVIPSLSAVNSAEFAFNIEMSIKEGVPTDRFIVGVTTPSLTDPTDQSGIFPGVLNESAIAGAAEWVASASDESYQVAGISVASAQNDYFNISLIYQNIRYAISVMNPSPKN